MSNTRTPGTSHQTATGGTVTYHPWGLVHKAGSNYTGKAVPVEKDAEFDGQGLTTSK